MVDMKQRIKHLFMDKAAIDKAAAEKAHQNMIKAVGEFLDSCATRFGEELENYRERIEKRDDPETTPEELEDLRLTTISYALGIDARDITAEDREELKDKFDAIRQIARDNNVRLTLRGLPGEEEPLLSYMDPDEPQNPLQVEIQTSQPYNKNQSISYKRNKGISM